MLRAGTNVVMCAVLCMSRTPRIKYAMDTFCWHVPAAYYQPHSI